MALGNAKGKMQMQNAKCKERRTAHAGDLGILAFCILHFELRDSQVTSHAMAR
jgi:hypothetical protein